MTKVTRYQLHMICIHRNFWTCFFFYRKIIKVTTFIAAALFFYRIWNTQWMYMHSLLDERLPYEPAVCLSVGLPYFPKRVGSLTSMLSRALIYFRWRTEQTEEMRFRYDFTQLDFWFRSGCFCLDPDPVFKFLRIRVKYPNPDPRRKSANKLL